MTSAPAVAVLVGEHPAPALTELNGRADVLFTGTSGLAEAIRGARVLLLWDFFSGALQPLLPVATELEWVHVAAAGVDGVLTPEFVASGIRLTNARGVFEEPIAEYVLACVLATAKDLPRTVLDQRERRWRQRETRTIAGSRAVLLGTGGIARATARLLSAVGIEVSAVGRRARWDPYLGEVSDWAGAAPSLATADWVIAALPLTAGTRGIIDAGVLTAIRPGAAFFNVGRGATVDEDALLSALDTHLAAAVLDCFTQEPLAPGHPFWTHPHVLVSPHTSSRTTGWLERLERQFLAEFDSWTAGRRSASEVDPRIGYPPG